jgi:hypothetical protein
MITAIEIENFKAIGERVRVPLKPITLLFGANSSGKSTIVQALHYAREVFTKVNLNVDRPASGGDSVELGGFQNILHNHDLTKQPLRLRIELDLCDEGLPLFGDEFQQWVEDSKFNWDSSIYQASRACRSASVDVSIELRGREEVILYLYQVGLNGEEIAKVGIPPEGRNAAIEWINLEHPLLRVSGLGGMLGGKRYFRVLPDNCPPLFELLSSVKSPATLRCQFRQGNPSAFPPWDEVMAVKLDHDVGSPEANERSVCQAYALSTLISGPGRSTRDALQSFRYLGPLRVIPERTHLPPRLEDASRWPSGLAAWDALHRRDQAFVEQVNVWMSQLKCGYTVLLKDYVEVDRRILPGKEASADALTKFGNRVNEEPTKRRVALVPDGQSIELSPADLGVGISQLLPAVVLALSSEKQLLAIEQPELHLHPALQARLGDLFIESALGDRKNTVILETHSEHLILRLLRRIRETTEDALPQGARRLRPEDVSVIYVEPGDKGVKVSPIRIDETGEFIDRWPKGFFEERVDELF